VRDASNTAFKAAYGSSSSSVTINNEPLAAGATYYVQVASNSSNPNGTNYDLRLFTA
jgi:hypothetical protein